MFQARSANHGQMFQTVLSSSYTPKSPLRCVMKGLIMYRWRLSERLWLYYFLMRHSQSFLCNCFPLNDHFPLKTLLSDFTPPRGDTHAVMSLTRCLVEVLAEGELFLGVRVPVYVLPLAYLSSGCTCCPQ